MTKLGKKHIFLSLTIISSFLVFLINVFEYFSAFYYPSLFYAKETLLIASLIFAAFFWKNITKEFDDITSLLKNLIIIIVVFYLLIAIKSIFFHGELFSDFFPQKAISLQGLLISGIISFFVIFLVPALIIILKSFFLYKRKRLTPLLFDTYVIFAIISSLLISINQNPYAPKLEDGWDINQFISYITIGYSFFLSFRHHWVTYLPKKNKFIYSAASLFVVPAIIVLFDYMETSVTAFSIFLSSFTNIIWFFTIFYSINSAFFLLLQLPTAKEFHKKLQDLDLIHKSGQKLNRLSADKNLYLEILSTASELLQCNDVWLELFNSETNASPKLYTINCNINLLRDFTEHSKHHKIGKHILKEKKSVLIMDLKEHKLYDAYYKWKNSLRTLMAVPLFSTSKDVLGILYLVHEKPYAFDMSDLAIMESYCVQAALFLENSRLLEETLKQERLKQELRIAREVQINLLPKSIPTIENVDIAADSLTAYEVGGDFYDFFRYKDGQYGFVLGDVSGKGTQAAFYMAEFKGIVQSLASTCNSPHELATMSNTVLFPNIETKSFITAIFAKFNFQRSELSFVRSGHASPVFFDAASGKLSEIQLKGIGLGLTGGKLFNNTLEELSIPYGKDNIILFYTDGLSELMNQEHQEMPFNEIKNLLLTRNRLSAEEIKEQILNHTFTFLQNSPINDDLTVFIIKFK